MVGWKRKLFDASLFFHRRLAQKRGLDIYIQPCRLSASYKLDSYEPRVAALEYSSREIYRYNIGGAAAELGVYRGDFAKMINHYFPDRKLYLFDTFKGFDERDILHDREKKLSKATADWSGTSVEIVLEKMEHRENCVVCKGYFPDTAEGIDDKFCFVSLDADLYPPILAGLEFFYPRLVHGGVIMIHDFNYANYLGVRKAVKEFCDRNNIGYVCLSDVAGSVVIAK